MRRGTLTGHRERASRRSFIVAVLAATGVLGKRLGGKATVRPPYFPPPARVAPTPRTSSVRRRRRGCSFGRSSHHLTVEVPAAGRCSRTKGATRAPSPMRTRARNPDRPPRCQSHRDRRDRRIAKAVVSSVARPRKQQLTDGVIADACPWAKAQAGPTARHWRRQPQRAGPESVGRIVKAVVRRRPARRPSRRIQGPQARLQNDAFT